jgi:hypothetical protein
VWFPQLDAILPGGSTAPRDLDHVQYWTLFIATPAIVDDQGHIPRCRELISDPLLSLRFMVVRQATEFLNNIRRNYEGLLDKIESNLGDRNGIFNAVEHDRLLIDDASFIRSRRYFWTIDALDTFSFTITTSITIHSQFMDSLNERSSRVSQSWNRGSPEDEILRNKEIALKEFQRLQERIRALKERVITLRDGVCICLFLT